MSSANPNVIVCAGGGGVGKTTTSAAIGLALARQGQKVLVVTVDPARRLAQAMGVPVDAVVHPAPVEPGIEDKLFALMPEPRASTAMFAELLFHDDAEALARVKNNDVYLTMADAAPSVHEIVSLTLVADAVRREGYDHVIVDTAPSRNALEFITYPGRLATLFEGRAVVWLSNMAAKQNPSESAPKDERGLLSWGKRHVEALIGRALSPRALTQLAGLFRDLAGVRDRFAALSRDAERLLLGDLTRYAFVSAPTSAARDDVRYLATRLKSLGQRPHAVVLNRADTALPTWLGPLADDGPPNLDAAVATLRSEYTRRVEAGDAIARSLSRSLSPKVTLRLPTIDAESPSDIVRSLADALAPYVSDLSAR